MAEQAVPTESIASRSFLSVFVCHVVARTCRNKMADSKQCKIFSSKKQAWAGRQFSAALRENEDAPSKSDDCISQISMQESERESRERNELSSDENCLCSVQDKVPDCLKYAIIYFISN